MFKKQIITEVENFFNFLPEKNDINKNIGIKVSEFYDVAPFPSYERDETIASIVTKGEKNTFIRDFKNFIGNGNKKILEVGAGTCQVSVYLAATTNNQIYAMDITKKSLMVGYEFAKKNDLRNINFILADIFDDVIEKEQFDYIFCSGVLHHTKDTQKSFEILSKYLKKEGYFILGLYNKFGRFRTFFRQFIYKHVSKKLTIILDPYLRKVNDIKSEKHIAWVRDQYAHPVERSHTYDEVLKWFNQNNIEYLNFVPSKFINDEEVFYKKASAGNFFERIFEQIWMNFTNLGGEGGLFIAIGKKNDN
jgi:ubiquinone/menaquinone biosynthesis C-methylase UbiE|tara:strand:- start:2340 stop:3257 length:918 start_codon:yes stop_codon:yes gene_type:complete